MKKLSLSAPVAKSRLFTFLTVALLIVSVLAMFILGFAQPYGIDGGYILQVDFGSRYDNTELKAQLAAAGVKDYQLRAADNGYEAVVFSEEMTPEQAAAVWEGVKAAYGLEDTALISNDFVSTGVDGTSNRRVVLGTILFVLVAMVATAVFFGWQAAVAGFMTLVVNGTIFWGLMAGSRAVMTDSVFGGFALTLLLGLVFSWLLFRALQDALGKQNETLENAVDGALASVVNAPVMLSLMVVAFALPLMFMGGSVFAGVHQSMVLAALAAAYSAACFTGIAFYGLKKKSGNTAMLPLWKLLKK